MSVEQLRDLTPNELYDPEVQENVDLIKFLLKLKTAEVRELKEGEDFANVTVRFSNLTDEDYKEVEEYFTNPNPLWFSSSTLGPNKTIKIRALDKNSYNYGAIIEKELVEWMNGYLR
jgi:hypothetical protein